MRLFASRRTWRWDTPQPQPLGPQHQDLVPQRIERHFSGGKDDDRIHALGQPPQLNAEQVRLTGKKAEQKEYFRHSGYMGGDRMIPFRRMQERHPERVIELAVKGMLPKNTLGRRMLRKLKVYAGPEHPHASQSPQPFDAVAS